MGLSGMGGGPGMGSAAGMFEDERKPSGIPRPEPDDYGAARKSAAPPKGKGMVLGSKGKQSSDVLKAIQAEDALAGLSAPAPATKAREDRKPAQATAASER
jgi:hypothetical protein